MLRHIFFFLPRRLQFLFWRVLHACPSLLELFPMFDAYELSSLRKSLLSWNEISSSCISMLQFAPLPKLRVHHPYTQPTVMREGEQSSLYLFFRVLEKKKKGKRRGGNGSVKKKLTLFPIIRRSVWCMTKPTGRPALGHPFQYVFNK